MSPSSRQRRITPASGAYQRRSRMLLVLAPVAGFTLFAGAALWWFADDVGLHVPSWSTGAVVMDEPQLSVDTRNDLRIQLQLLQSQWQRLNALDALQGKGKARPAPAIALSLQPTAHISDADLRERVDILSRALDQRLFANKPKAGSGRLMPVNGVTPSSNFGLRLDPFSKKLSVHNGIDFVAPLGTPILAAEAGTVKTAGLTPQFGWSVELDHGNGITTRYAHAYRLWVRAGDRVNAGEKIAEVGSTGKSTGPHLHFEVRYNGAPLNPLRFLAAR
ncbi:MAG: M23 family metallopeptidase [Neisseriaceae bacterium]|jgi:murein DD-endopeptidase MepM/ murein hydrolase activator NlpD|nr:family metallopeptidase [Pseudomonadota bacterium]RTL00652.1 MAG: M23 family metallopeptidase [Neisseriaceae bacterium]